MNIYSELTGHGIIYMPLSSIFLIMPLNIFYFYLLFVYLFHQFFDRSVFESPTKIITFL